jgi:hypothetical protein
MSGRIGSWRGRGRVESDGEYGDFRALGFRYVH